MTFPATRLTTYTPALPVKAADLNAIQDVMARLSPQWRWKIPILATDTTGPWHGTAASDAALALSDLTAGGAISITPLDLVVGDTITDYGANLTPGGVSAVVVELHHNAQNGTDTTVATFATAIGVGGRITKVGVSGAMVPHVVLDGCGYWIKVVATTWTLAAVGCQSGWV